MMMTYTNSSFTPPTQRRQDCLVLSVSAVWTQLQTRQDSFILSRPSFQFATVQSQIYWGLLKTWKLETKSRRDKTVLTPLTWTRRNKTMLSCPCRRCEQAITHLRRVYTSSWSWNFSGPLSMLSHRPFKRWSSKSRCESKMLPCSKYSCSGATELLSESMIFNSEITLKTNYCTFI